VIIVFVLFFNERQLVPFFLRKAKFLRFFLLYFLSSESNFPCGRRIKRWPRVRARPAPRGFLTVPSRFTAKFEIILSLKGSAASAASRSLRHLYARPLRGLEKVGSDKSFLKKK
jgi:hypothetical protein